MYDTYEISHMKGGVAEIAKAILDLESIVDAKMFTNRKVIKEIPGYSLHLTEKANGEPYTQEEAEKYQVILEKLHPEITQLKANFEKAMSEQL